MINYTKLRISIFLLFPIFCVSCSKEDELLPPNSASVKGVKIATFPLSDQGAQWDIGSDADVYFTIESNNNVLYTFDKNNLFSNVKSTDLPLYFLLTTPYQLSTLNQTYYIGIYDYDNTSSDDLIALVPFNPNDFKQDRPEIRNIVANDASIEVSFLWE